MKKAFYIPARWNRCIAASILVLSGALVAGCSDSSLPSTSVDGSDVDQSASDGIPAALLQLQDDPDLLSEIPDVLYSVILANTGLQVAYTEVGQDLVAPALEIEAQWEYMQTCLEQNSVSPVVVVRETEVVPFTANDDVIFSREGIPYASASWQEVPLIQVLAADFDGSLGNPGFNLRSVMGRMLWISAGLAERDYPFACASQQTEQ